MFAQVGEHAGDEVFQLVAAAKDFSAGEGAAGEMGLQRLDEAALLFGLEVVLDGGGAGKDVGPLGSGGGFGLLEVENGAEGLGKRAEGEKCGEADGLAAVDEGDGTVGGAEIEADGIEGKAG